MWIGKVQSAKDCRRNDQSPKQINSTGDGLQVITAAHQFLVPGHHYKNEKKQNTWTITFWTGSLFHANESIESQPSDLSKKKIRPIMTKVIPIPERISRRACLFN